MSGATVKPKCYVFICVGCDGISISERADRLTCSSACRTKAHRNGALGALRAQATAHGVPAAMFQQASAVQRVRPDLLTKVMDGSLELEDAAQEAYLTFVRGLFGMDAL